MVLGELQATAVVTSSRKIRKRKGFMAIIDTKMRRISRVVVETGSSA